MNKWGQSKNQKKTQYAVSFYSDPKFALIETIEP